jgi:hypothetical protein
LRVEIDLPNPAGWIFPGMYANASVVLDRPGVWSLPLPAVASSGGRSYCWILQDGHVTRTEINTGLSDGTWIEVERRASSAETARADESHWMPLDGSEPVILGDLSALKEGGAVRVDFAATSP